MDKFFTPADLRPADYRLKLDANESSLRGVTHIKWTHHGTRPLSILRLCGQIDNLEISNHAGAICRENPDFARITLDAPMLPGDTIHLRADFSADMAISPLCDGDGSILMPNGNIWYPALLWDIPMGGDFSAEISAPDNFRICATGHQIGNIFQQNSVRKFGLLLCQNLEYAEIAAGDVAIKAHYPKADEPAMRELMKTTADAIAFFRDLLGFYPGRSYSMVKYSSSWSGGGNWATGIAHFHGLNRIGQNPWIAAHELAHMYFGEYVIDGDYVGWLWIALGMMLDEEFSESRGIAYPWGDRAEAVYSYKQNGGDTTIWRSREALAAAEAANNDYNTHIRHDKAFCVIQSLAKTIGKTTLFAILRQILADYPGRPLRTMDFWQICENRTGMRLDKFFTDTLHSNDLQFLDNQEESR